jgi:hypothetical protein
MNLAVIHALGRLYRKTGQSRYLAMMREIEKDWQQAGDYFRTGLAGVEYFKIPRPRWESLHDLQGLVELYLITGEERYRRSFLNHWQSIRRCDRHNNGAFSSGEQATGNPYQPGAIETCCTVAWMAITIDALRLCGDPAVADELELSTYNGLLGAQHPSGSWFTYNTPMDGVREASHHAIVFQARAGTPDLNCCSVNGPRGLGMLSEWAVMQGADGLAVNYYGPMRAECRLADGTPVALTQDTRYPLDGKVRIRVSPAKPSEFTLKLRIPGWARGAEVRVSPGPAEPVRPGYLELRRRWTGGDEITLDLGMPLRYESGDLEMSGRMSLYRGPILLAYDQRLNSFDESQIPVIAPSDLAQAQVSFPEPDAGVERAGRFAPWLLVDLPAGKDSRLRLCDFATAGSSGSRYVSWLAGRELAPPPPVPFEPCDGAAVPPGHVIFTWRRPAADKERTHTLLVAETPDLATPVLAISGKPGNRLIVSPQQSSRLSPKVDYYWKLIARNGVGATESLPPAKRFRIDPSLPPLAPDQLSEYGEGPGGIVVAAGLAGDPKPSYGKLLRSRGFQPAPGIDGKPGGAIQLDGQAGMLVYALRAFPSTDYTVSVWFFYDRKEDRLGQVLSAWDHVMDDPLRICIVGGKLYARIESGSAWSTEGVAVEPGRWYHAAVVKSGSQLALYVDGKPAARITAAGEVHSAARDFALGGNPHYTGPSEHLACRVARLAFYARAMAPHEIAEVFRREGAR